jgi:hypothetical protein
LFLYGHSVEWYVDWYEVNKKNFMKIVNHSPLVTVCRSNPLISKKGENNGFWIQRTGDNKWVTIRSVITNHREKDPETGVELFPIQTSPFDLGNFLTGLKESTAWIRIVSYREQAIESYFEKLRDRGVNFEANWRKTDRSNFLKDIKDTNAVAIFLGIK